jgi:hypothetical protein
VTPLVVILLFGAAVAQVVSDDPTSWTLLALVTGWTLTKPTRARRPAR